MAAISVLKTDGPLVITDIHLDHIYISINDEQVTQLANGTYSEVNFDSIELIIEEYPLGTTGIPDMGALIKSTMYNLDRYKLTPLKYEGEPTYTSRYKVNNSFYVMTYRLITELEGPEPDNLLYSDTTIVQVNNFTNWIYPELFQDLVKDEVQERLTQRNNMTLFGNLLPIGGSTNDIQILRPQESYCQEFAFDDFYVGGIFSARFDSDSISWWEIEVQEGTYNKQVIHPEVKQFLIALLSVPGIKEIIEDRRVLFTSEQILSIYGITQADVNLYIPLSFKINGEPYTIFLVGDFSFIDTMMH